MQITTVSAARIHRAEIATLSWRDAHPFYALLVQLYRTAAFEAAYQG